MITLKYDFIAKKNELIKLVKIQVSKTNNKITCKLNQKPAKVILDPNYLVIDKDVEDNEYDLEF